VAVLGEAALASPSATPKKATASSPTVSTSASPASELVSLENQVATLVNQERAKAGCDPLRTDERLRAAARAYSQDMADKGYFSHTGQDGSSFVDREARAGYPRNDAAGENIAMGYRTPAEVMNGWMNSEGHRANILNCGFKALGVGLGRTSSGTAYWTQA
jgi:uncharacterized protein YkwD